MVANNANVYLPGTIQIPSSLELVAATQTNPMEITVSVNSTTASNTYREGQLIKLNIPFGYGMQQANGLVVKILEVSGNNFILDINSSQFDPFSIPASGTKPASIAPSGSNNLQMSNTTNQISFQSLNNRGN